MRGFIHILNKSNYKNTVDLENVIHTFKSKTVKVFSDKKGNIESYYFSNEFDEYPYQPLEGYFYTPVGVFTKNVEDIYKELILSDLKHQIQFMKNLQGQFSLSYADFNNDKITAITHIGRIETIYIYDDIDKTIIGSDPLFVSAVSNQGTFVFDEHNFVSFILNGYFADDLTPFKDVRALPSDSIINITKENVQIYKIDDFSDGFLTKVYGKKDFDDLTDNFLDAFNTRPNYQNINHNIALTGGKDSRLIFAALSSNNASMTAFTNGFPDNPDVLIAKQIADMYGIEHRTMSKRKKTQDTPKSTNIDINLYNRIKRVMMSTSGLVYGYENVANPGSYRGDRTFDGLGAELVKGGFSSLLKADDNADKNKLVRIFNNNHKFLKDGQDNTFKSFLDDYVTSDLPLNRLQIDYSLKYRTGRLTSAAKNSNHYIKQSHSPFLDNKFLRTSMRIDYSQIYNEDVHYELFARLDARLLDVPFAKNRWRRDGNEPSSPSHFKTWITRAPKYPNSVLGGYNWRKIHVKNQKIVDQFKNIILSNPNHIVFNIVDYTAVKRQFTNPGKAFPFRVIWSLASLIIFIDELQGNDMSSVNKTIKFKLPSSTVSKFKGKKEIIDISDKFYPLNDSIKLDNENNVSIKNDLKHRKIKLYDEKYGVAPKKKNITTADTLTLKFHVTQDDDTPINAVIYLFKDGKRVTYKNIKATRQESGSLYSVIVDSEGKYDSFKLLISFNNLSLAQTAKLDYAYYELKY